MNVTIHLRSFGFKRLGLRLHGHPSSQAVMGAFFDRYNIRPQSRRNYIFFNCLGLADPAKVTNHLGLHYHVQSGIAQHNEDMIRAWAKELQEHPKLKNRSGDVSEVVFEFDNSYSWWTPKVVELVLVCRDAEPDPRFRPPPPLHRSATRESSPPPARRTGRVELAGCAGLRLPDLVLPVAMEAGQLALAAQDLELYRFVALVDACLAGAEALRPQTPAGDSDGGPGGGADAALLSRLAPLLEGVAELRKVCGEQLPARSV